MKIIEKYKQNILFRLSFICFGGLFTSMLLLCSIVGLAYWRLSLHIIEEDLTSEEIHRIMKIFEYQSIGFILLMAVAVTIVMRLIINHQLVKPVRKMAQDAKEKDKISTELAIAGDIQQVFLPKAFPDNAYYDVYALMDPAKEIGGDFYDFFALDEDRIAIVVADVSDKGVPASIVMSITKTLIYDHIKTDKDLGKALSHVNNLVFRPGENGMFATVFAGILDLRNGEFSYINAGHEPPFISKAGGAYEIIKLSPQIAVGVFENVIYKPETMILEPGDRFFQYTDGLTDATPDKEKDVFFGMEGIKNSLNAHKALNSKDLLTAVKADVDAFQANGPQYDDITMLCLEFKQKK